MLSLFRYLKYFCSIYVVYITALAYSSGWLEKLKNRWNLKSRTVSGESGSVDMEFVARERVKLNEILSKFAPKDRFNIDEMGLFYQLAPNRTLCTNQQSGKKVSKKRITVAVCCNQDGSEYLNIF